MNDMDSFVELEEKNYSANQREQVKFPGQVNAVRYFDPEDKIDALRLKQISESPGAYKFLSGPMLSDEDYIEWMNEKGLAKDRRHHLFAVTASDGGKRESIGEATGYVYFYFGTDEEKVVDRVVEEGILKKGDIEGKKIFEISYAKHPDAPPRQMADGIMQSCLLVSRIVAEDKDLDPKNTLIIAYVKPENTNSIKALNQSGFKEIGTVSYYDEEEGQSKVFVLDWDRLHNQTQYRTFAAVRKATK